MITLMFEKSGQYFNITISNKRVHYWDKFQGKLWGGPLRYLPPDPEVMRKIDLSRNKIPQSFKELFRVTKEELLEFEEAKTDEELKILVLRDAKKHQCRIIKSE